MGSEEVIVIEGVSCDVTSRLYEQDGGRMYAHVAMIGGEESLRWPAPDRLNMAAAERDRDLMLNAMRQMADDYVAQVPEQSQALTSALMEVERYKALHQTAAAGWQRADEEASEADRALRIMSLRLHHVETALAQSFAERDEARRALECVRGGGAS